MHSIIAFMLGDGSGLTLCRPKIKSYGAAAILPAVPTRFSLSPRCVNTSGFLRLRSIRVANNPCKAPLSGFSTHN